MVTETAEDMLLLTIGIPTWNRAGNLTHLLGQLAERCPAAALDRIEVVVSDNASADDTQEVVLSLARTAPFAIRYRRNDINIGAVRNAIETLKAARGRYWTFFGDDDEVVCENLSEILRMLSAEDAPTVAVFRSDPCRPPWCFEHDEDLSSAEAAERLFYYAGNAGRFAVRTDRALEALSLLPGTGWTCWPQTELMFVAMALSREPEPLHVSPLVSASSKHHGSNIVYTSYHMAETPMLALYRASARIRPLVGNEVADAAATTAVGWRSVSPRLEPIFFYKVFSDLPEDIRALRCATTRTLRVGRFGFLRPLLVLWLLAHTPRWLDRLALGAYLVVKYRRGARIQWGNYAAAYPRERRLEAAESSGRTRAHTPRDLE